MTTSKGQVKKHRDSAATRQGLIRAVGALLAREGFKGLGINSVAKEAGVDKVLIYRYFGGMPELLKAFGTSGEFWPSFEEMTGGDIERLRRQPFARSVAAIMKNYIKAIRGRPLTLEILAWESVENNELTRGLEAIREEVSLRLFKELKQSYRSAAGDVAAVTALLAGGVSYLAIRSRSLKAFNTVDIRSEAGWRRLEKAVEVICENSLAPGKPGRRKS